MNNKRIKLKFTDIGYHGKPIESLTTKELQIAFLEVVQLLYDREYATRDELPDL